MKEFTVRNGKGLIRLVTDDWSEALVIEKAVAVKWPDCGGSIAEYFALTPYPSAKQQELAAAIEAGLAATDEQEVLDGVGGFLELFENATYSVRLRSFSRPYILIFDHVDPLTGRAEPGSRFMANCYPEDLPTFVFTRSMDSVDRDRVAHYAKLIGGGARPRALVYRLESENCETADFILDGHHKALAYDQLGLELPVVHIACTSARPVPQREQHAHVRTLLDPEAIEHLTYWHPNDTVDNGNLEPVFTGILDRILSSRDDFFIRIPELLMKAYHDGDAAQRAWAEARIAVVYQNPLIGNRYQKVFAQGLPRTFVEWREMLSPRPLPAAPKSWFTLATGWFRPVRK